MYRLRLFAVRHSRGFEWLYRRLERLMIGLDPLFARIRRSIEAFAGRLREPA